MVSPELPPGITTWTHLNRIQKGSYGVHFVKMEFAMHGFLVFSSDVDDRGIDFVARNEHGKHFDVQVKAITGKNYTYVKESKFLPGLWVALVVLFSEAAPQVYLLNRDDWTQDKSGLLKYRKYPNSKEPEFGIHLAKKREADLKRFAFKDRIARLQDGSNL